MNNGIVILNYINSSVTQNTVNLLLQQKDIEKFLIVIVDNGSNNNSVEFLKNSFDGVSNITILSNPQNLGYAQGNNIGIRYLRQQNIDTILVMNSDISFKNKNGLYLLFQDIPSDIGIVGPNIIGENGQPANPIYLSVDFKNTLIRFFYNMLHGLIPNVLKNKIKTKTNIVSKRNVHGSKVSYSNDDFFLHGSAFILTPNYFNIFPELYPKTFLYYEAQILKILSNKFGIRYYYNSSVDMLHLEDQSSEMSYGNKPNTKQKMVAKSQFEALLLYFKLLNSVKFRNRWVENVKNDKF